MIDWQPIETCPQDGTRVLMGAEDPVVEGRWDYAVSWWVEGVINTAWTHWARINPPEGK